MAKNPNYWRVIDTDGAWYFADEDVAEHDRNGEDAGLVFFPLQPWPGKVEDDD